MYERTGDPWSLGLVGVVELAPVLLLMVVAGNAADRYPRRNVAIFAHGLVAIAAIGLALVSWRQGPTVAIYLVARADWHGARICVAVGEHDSAATPRTR